MSGESTEAPKLLELSIEYDRESVIYAKDHFTLYISVENKSQKKITVWDFNIMGSSEFYLQTFYRKTGYIEGLPAGSLGTRIARFICSIFSSQGILEEFEKDKPPVIEMLSDVQKRNKARKDILKEHYYDRLQKKGAKYLPWQLSPEESLTVNFEVETKHSVLFIPGTYKLNLYVDYSTIENKFLFCWDTILKILSKNDTTLFQKFLLTDYDIDWINDADIQIIDCGMAIIAKNKNNNSLTLRLNETKTKVFLEINNCNIDELIAIDEKGKLNIYGKTKYEEFARITKIETVEVFVPLITLMRGSVIGAMLGVTVRILLRDKAISGIISWTYIPEILVSIILSIVAVTALARRTGSQTIITIQDFWGGLFIGFMAGYAGHDYVNTLLGIGPGEILTNQTENVTNQISTLTDQTNNLTNQVSNLIDQINSSQ